MRLLILAALSLSLISGCVYDRFDFQSKSFTRISFFYDAQVQSVQYIPETGAIVVEGYDGVTKVDKLIELLKAAP